MSMQVHFEEALQTIAAHAGEVDREANFPTRSVEALRGCGALGLVSAADVGGAGKGLREAVDAVDRVARACGSTAMVLCMHYAGTVVLEQLGADSVRRDIAAGRHLSTLAFSEQGSRSHFWAPLSTATPEGERVRLDAQKSWITAATHADAYVWSSRASVGEGSTLWLVPRQTPGLRATVGFDGLGLRGNDSGPVTAEAAYVPLSQRLGHDGKGGDVMLGVVLPWFACMNAACSVGIMERALQGTLAHIASTRHQHLGTSLADLPTIRAYVARMKLTLDQARTLLDDTVTAITTGRADAQLRVLEVKAVAGEAATQATDLAMRVCGGAAFRKELGVERAFRDARAAGVMAPTSDQLYDFLGRALAGLPLFG